MYAAARQRRQNSAIAKNKTVHRRVIRDHRKYHLAAACIGHGARNHRAIRAQGLGPRGRPVVNRDAVPGAQQTLRDP